MKIEAGIVYARVLDATEQEVEWLDAYLTFAEARFIAGGKWGKAKRVTSSYSLFKRWKFPAGLVPVVQRAGTRDGCAIEVVDGRCAPPCTPYDASYGPPLRDYQAAAVERIFDPSRGATRGRGIIAHPTGAGKSRVAAALVMRTPIQWLFLAHRTTLANQAADRFDALSEERAGRLTSANWDVQRFTAATFSILHKRRDQPEVKALLEAVQGVIADECHTVAAVSINSVIMRCVSAYYRVGLSATPLDRSDKRSVLTIGAIGPVIHRVRPDELIARGILAQPKITMVPVDQTWRQGDRLRKWATVERDLLVKSRIRNRAVVAACQHVERPAMVFVTQVAHGKRLLPMIEDAGLTAAFVDGSVPEKHRKAAIDRLQAGDLDVCVATVVFVEGVDIPNLRSVIVATGRKSVIQALQRIGRGMRTVAGKTEFQVVDFYDRGDKWTAKHSRKRVQAYQREGHKVRLGQLDGPTKVMDKVGKQ